MTPHRVLTLVATLAAASVGAQAPPDAHRRFFPLGDVRLESGVVLPNATLAYATFGTLNAAAKQRDPAAVVVRIGPSRLRLPDRPRPRARSGARLHHRDRDVRQRLVVVAEQHRRRRSTGRAFPRSPSATTSSAAHRLLTSELGVTHLRAIVGFSMGAQQAFQWAVSHPGFVDQHRRLLRHRENVPARRRQARRRDQRADGRRGVRRRQLHGAAAKGLAAWSRHWAGWVFSQEWWRRELFKPRWASVDAVLDERTGRDAVRDANNLISQARTWQRHNVGDTAGFAGDHERALRSIQARVLYMPCETDLYFPVGDARYESQFIRGVSLVPDPVAVGPLGRQRRQRRRQRLHRRADPSISEVEFPP